MHESLDLVGHHYTSPLSASGTSSDVTTKQEEEIEKDSQPLTTHYISSSCMLLTYFTGDIASNVDEHFSRALSQPSSFNAENQGSKPTTWKGERLLNDNNVNFRCIILEIQHFWCTFHMGVNFMCRP